MHADAFRHAGASKRKQLWRSGSGWAKQGRDDRLRCEGVEGGGGETDSKNRVTGGADRYDDTQCGANAIANVVPTLVVVIAATLFRCLGRGDITLIGARGMARLVDFAIHFRSLESRLLDYADAFLTLGRPVGPRRHSARHQCQGEHAAQQYGRYGIHGISLSVLLRDGLLSTGRVSC